MRRILPTLRLVGALAVVAAAVLPLALAQAVALATGWWSDGMAPRLWHRTVLKVLGIRVHMKGTLATGRPLLIASNHVSWTDIMVLGSLGRLHFVAKAEVRSWPVMGTLARLQRTVFVERERRRATPEQAREIGERLKDGDPMVLFAEGTTGDGNRVLPFNTTLFGAAQLALGTLESDRVLVQPVAIAYVRRGGLRLDRRERAALAWIGDTPLLPHLRHLMTAGVMDVEVHFGEAIAFSAVSNRKTVARQAEKAVREMLAPALAGRNREM